MSKAKDGCSLRNARARLTTILHSFGEAVRYDVNDIYTKIWTELQR